MKFRHLTFVLSLLLVISATTQAQRIVFTPDDSKEHSTILGNHDNYQIYNVDAPQTPVTVWDVFPNPARVVIYVEANHSDPTAAETVKLVNFQGDVMDIPVIRQENNFELQVESLSPGTYGVQIISGQGVDTRKVTIR